MVQNILNWNDRKWISNNKSCVTIIYINKSNKNQLMNQNGNSKPTISWISSSYFVAVVFCSIVCGCVFPLLVYILICCCNVVIAVVFSSDAIRFVRPPYIGTQTLRSESDYNISRQYLIAAAAAEERNSVSTRWSFLSFSFLVSEEILLLYRWNKHDERFCSLIFRPRLTLQNANEFVTAVLRPSEFWSAYMLNNIDTNLARVIVL